MALKSGGTIPPKQDIADANQAIALLGTMHHWRASKQNRVNGELVGYEVTITHAGKRVTVRRKMFVDAVIAAFEKLRGKGVGPKLKLVR
jgi:hypothetical protein